jgi:hypothetical protein
VIRRWTIPITIMSLVFGSALAAASSASAARIHHPATTRTRPGDAISSFRPGGPMARAGGPMRAPGRNVANATVTSTNWSGYAVTGGTGTFTSVSASWTEPTASCSGNGGRHRFGSSSQYAAFWVGLDGYANSTVEQTGSDSDCNGTTPDYYGWYEMYPAGPVYFTNPVQPGDSMSASVTFSGTSTYTLVLTDSTRSWTQTVVQNRTGLARASAEVITEAPSSGRGVLPLANFATINYTASTANLGSMGTLSPIGIVMVGGGGQPKDSTSAMSGSGAFSNTWLRSS